MNNQEFYGIYINNEIPMLKDNKNINKYNGYIKPDFEGKAYIIENCKEMQELKSNQKYRKKGKHTIKYINSKNENFFIDIEIKKHGILWLLLFLLALLLLLALILSQLKVPDNNNEDYNIWETIDYAVNLDGNRYVFNINDGSTSFKDINLADNSEQNNMIYPGSSGYFYIKISTKNGNKDINYSMQIKDEQNKPKFLQFEVDGNTYESMEELAKSINGTMKKNTTKTLKIKWFWKYETNEGDQFDTTDGETLENYKVLMRVIGNSKEA